MSQMGADGREEIGERDPETYAVIGAAMGVHTTLGCGFAERVYQEALALEFGLRGIAFQREVDLLVCYKSVALECGYRADFICFGNIIVELKALDSLADVYTHQVINYLKATGHTRAVLINFGAKRLEYKRIVFNHLRQSASSADN